MREEATPVIAIIGGGFCGLMTAINLIEKADQSFTIKLINDDFPTAKGVAFSAHTQAYLLNVPASNMSCYADDLRHFLRWLKNREEYKNLPENMLERAFVPRKLYGDYLHQTWQEIKNINPLVTVIEINTKATDIQMMNDKIVVFLQHHESFEADYAVLATGNEKPADIRILNTDFYKSPLYFSNPWHADAVSNCDDKDVLIIGNGLTMVDTVLGLLEQGFSGTIHSLSPNGFSLLPHTGTRVLYKEMLNELEPPYQLSQLFSLFKKHIKAVSIIGLSVEPVIDSVRVKTGEIWASLSLNDKKQFLRHIKYKWGIARHRIPAHIHRKLQQLRISKKLVCFKATLQNMEECDGGVCVSFYNKETNQPEQIIVERVINCTGPVCDISRSDNELIKHLVASQVITPDPLKLGIHATFDGAIINASGDVSNNFFTIGSHLKGILWESTAVPDLRVQAERLSLLLLQKIDAASGNKSFEKRTSDRFKRKINQPLKEEELIEYYI